MCFPIWLRVDDSIASCARKSMWTASEYVFIFHHSQVSSSGKWVAERYLQSGKETSRSGLYRQLKDTFQCHICRCTPIEPPVIFTRCCHRILGCQTCVDAWYGGEAGISRTCPMCRFERAYSETTTLRGLDDFLRAIQPLLAEEATATASDTEQ